MTNRRKYWEETAISIKERLSEPLGWYPYPLLVSFGLVFILSAHTLTGINPRLGSPADVLKFPSTHLKDGAIWLAVTTIGDQVVLTTGDRHVFRWDLGLKNRDGVNALITYLKNAVQDELLTASLTKEANRSSSMVVIAADKNLNFAHFKPVLEALAAARITNYAFETQFSTSKEEYSVVSEDEH